jgi:hypothetical protein
MDMGSHDVRSTSSGTRSICRDHRINHPAIQCTDLPLTGVPGVAWGRFTLDCAPGSRCPGRRWRRAYPGRVYRTG